MVSMSGYSYKLFRWTKTGKEILKKQDKLDYISIIDHK